MIVSELLSDGPSRNSVASSMKRSLPPHRSPLGRLAGGTDTEEIELVIKRSVTAAGHDAFLDFFHRTLDVEILNLPAAGADEMIGVLTRKREREIIRAVRRTHPPHQSDFLQPDQNSKGRRGIAHFCDGPLAAERSPAHRAPCFQKMQEQSAQRLRPAHAASAAKIERPIKLVGNRQSFGRFSHALPTWPRRRHFSTEKIAPPKRHGKSLAITILTSERDCARRDNFFPTSFAFRNRAVAFARSTGVGLASSVRQLHPSHAPLFMQNR